MNRFRRLRQNKTLRDLVSETTLSTHDFIYPLFVLEGENKVEEIKSMPGIYRYTIDKLDNILDEIVKYKIPGILIFGIPLKKDPFGKEAYHKDGIVQKAIRYIKAKYPQLLVIADICLCEYTDHGHCGVIKDKLILNDETLPLLAKMAQTTVDAGADIVAPSDMMDNDVKTIRETLDKHGHYNTPIMGYSAKFSSSYYSPFRDAAFSAPSFGDRKTYQMDYRNGKEAIEEIYNDIEMGADIVMVKPALAYLDIVKEASLSINKPIAVYNVSGEYAMIKAAASLGYIDEKRVVLENLTAFKRAGAKIIITYHALEAAKWLINDNKN